MDTTGDILNTKQAASLLGAHVETIRRMARKGEIPTFKIGTDWRYSKKALLQWAQTHHLRQKQPCVLIVDDETVICDMIRYILKPTGRQVLAAHSGSEGLSIVSRESIDLILLDLSMPGMTGPEFLRELRKTHPQIPVVIITGYPDSALMMEAYHYGPLLLVPKPVEKKLLLSAVDMALNGTLDCKTGGAHPQPGV